MLLLFRGYAASCRVKRDEEEETIKADIDKLEREVQVSVAIFIRICFIKSGVNFTNII
jgi:hypothetical protein